MKELSPPRSQPRDVSCAVMWRALERTGQQGLGSTHSSLSAKVTVLCTDSLVVFSHLKRERRTEGERGARKETLLGAFWNFSQAPLVKIEFCARNGEICCPATSRGCTYALSTPCVLPNMWHCTEKTVHRAMLQAVRPSAPDSLSWAHCCVPSRSVVTDSPVVAWTLFSLEEDLHHWLSLQFLNLSQSWTWS